MPAAGMAQAGDGLPLFVQRRPALELPMGAAGRASEASRAGGVSGAGETGSTGPAGLAAHGTDGFDLDLSSPLDVPAFLRRQN